MFTFRPIVAPNARNTAFRQAHNGRGVQEKSGVRNISHTARPTSSRVDHLRACRFAATSSLSGCRENACGSEAQFTYWTLADNRGYADQTGQRRGWLGYPDV